MIRLLDLLGIAVFAISGALVAGRKRMDVFGIVMVAIATAIGGGTIRDVILGIHPVFWIAEPIYVVVAALGALGAFVASPSIRFPLRPLLLFDAFGLAFYTVLGCQRTLETGVSTVIVVLMGMLTGVAGGIVRDLLCGEIPLIFRAELYATASLIGATLFAAMIELGVEMRVASVIAIAVGLLVRLAAIRWRLSLPVFRQREEVS